MTDKGILYIAYGEKAINLVESAITILRRFNKKLPVTVISDRKVKGADTWIEYEDTDLGARRIKTSMYLLTPYEKTLYMDADTELQCDPLPYFRLLDDVDLVIGQDPTRIFKDNKWAALNPAEVTATKEETAGGAFLYYNTGVILFRKNEAVKKLMDTWHEEWKRWGMHDQPAMFRAMYKCPVRIATMRTPFNTHQKNLAKFVFHAHRRASRQGAPK